MVLVDHQIRHAVDKKELMITNFDDACIQPASYDLRIGNLVYAPPHPDKPIDLAADGGAYRLPPYGNAVVTTHEDLKLPNDMIGRIGLKSGFARTGLVASTGPQIDPGFEGKLFVSLFNLTAASHVLKYQDTFLTIEFHSLDAHPDRPYAGPYQGKTTIGAEVLEALVRLEGVTLSQMQSQFTALAQHVEEWSGFARRFDEFMATMNRHTEAIDNLTRQTGGAYIQLHRDELAQETRKVPLKKAMDEVLALFRERKRLFYSDIADALQLDFATVIKACDELRKKGLIEGEANGKARPQKSRK